MSTSLTSCQSRLCNILQRYRSKWACPPASPGSACLIMPLCDSKGNSQMDHIYTAAIFPVTSHSGWEAQMLYSCVPDCKSYKCKEPDNYWSFSPLPDWPATEKMLVKIWSDSFSRSNNIFGDLLASFWQQLALTTAFGNYFLVSITAIVLHGRKGKHILK